MKSSGQNPWSRKSFWEKIMTPEWTRILTPLLRSKNTQELMGTITELYNTSQVCPPKADVFKAFRFTDFPKVRVVILGQDPYPDGKSACGLAFANSLGRQGMSASLKRIYQQLPSQGIGTAKDLFRWTKQGVLLLNTALTVEQGNAGSHAKLWNEFTTGVIKAISENSSGIIFMLWGSHAQAYSKIINENLHYILMAEHPVAGAYKGLPWDSQECFTKANEILLKNHGLDALIDW